MITSLVADSGMELGSSDGEPIKRRVSAGMTNYQSHRKTFSGC
jgi:hypothetical protein